MMGHKHLFQSWKNLELPLVLTAGKPAGSSTMTEFVIHVEKVVKPQRKGENS